MERSGRQRSANVQRLRDWVSNHNKLNLAMDFLNIGADLMLNNEESESKTEDRSDGTEFPLPAMESSVTAEAEEEHMMSRDSDKESDSGISNAKNDLESESDNDKEVEMYMRKEDKGNDEGMEENTDLDLDNNKSISSQIENTSSLPSAFAADTQGNVDEVEPRWSPKSCHCKVRKYVAADGGEFESKILCTNCRLSKGREGSKGPGGNRGTELSGEHVGGAILRRRNRDLALTNEVDSIYTEPELPQKTNQASSRRFNRVSRLERLKQWVEDIDLASVWSGETDPASAHQNDQREVTTPVNTPRDIKMDGHHKTDECLHSQDIETPMEKLDKQDDNKNEVFGETLLKEEVQGSMSLPETSEMKRNSFCGDMKLAESTELEENEKMEEEQTKAEIREKAEDVQGIIDNIGVKAENVEHIGSEIPPASSNSEEEDVDEECETTITLHNGGSGDLEKHQNGEINEESFDDETDYVGDDNTEQCENQHCIFPWLSTHSTDVSPARSLDMSALLTTIDEEAPSSSVAANNLLTPDEGIHDVSSSLSLLDSSLGQSAFSRSDFPHPLSTSSPKSESLTSGSSHSLNDSGVSAPNSGCLETMSLCSRSSTPLPRGKPRERSQSVSDMGYHTGASLLLRLPNKNARPISDSHLRQKLQGKKNVRLPEKDQRILELMMSKHEEEAYQNQLQRDAKLSWDEQMRSEKQTTENQRRLSLTKPKTGGSSGRLRRSNSAVQYAEQMAKLKEEEEALKMDRKQYLEYKQKQWEELHRKQQDARAQKIIEKKKKELERKKSVERSLQLREQEEAEYREQMKKKLENNLKRASSKKESKEHKDAMQRKYAKEAVAKRVQQRKEEIAKSRREDLEELKASIEYKHAAAEENLQKVEEEKELHLRMSHEERAKKKAKSRRSLMEQEVEMALWRKELGEHRKEMEEKASEVAHMTVEQKARRAQEERIAKEKEHRRNMHRLKKDEEAWKEEMKAQIAVKEFKSKLIQQERDHTIEESRAIAAQSQQLRDDLRKSYNVDSFDKKAQQVALQNRTLGVQGATKNMSSLSLG